MSASLRPRQSWGSSWPGDQTVCSYSSEYSCRSLLVPAEIAEEAEPVCWLPRPGRYHVSDLEKEVRSAALMPSPEVADEDEDLLWLTLIVPSRGAPLGADVHHVRTTASLPCLCLYDAPPGRLESDRSQLTNALISETSPEWRPSVDHPPEMAGLESDQQDALPGDQLIDHVGGPVDAGHCHLPLCHVQSLVLVSGPQALVS